MMSPGILLDDPKPAGKISPEKPSVVYSLYFKGLVSEDGSSAGFGVAILGHKDEVLFQMKGPVHGSDITLLEAELTALKRGLTEAMGLKINHLSIYCDSLPLYELVMLRSVPKVDKIFMLMADVQRIREGFASSFPIFVDGNSIKHAYKLARESIVSEIRIPMDPLRCQVKPARKKTCGICLDDDINADEMFVIEKCRHQFCPRCVRRHIEVRLLEGSVMRCPQFRCKSRLSFQKCESLLTPEMRKMWVLRIRENSIPVVDRIYCPYPRCSALMSKTEISKSGNGEFRRCCFKCRGYFCINCKVPWHANLSCNDYKRLHPNHTENDEKLKALASQRLWRQCPKCQHMIELSKGCVRVICRCGHKFCYRCGAGAGSCSHGHGLPPRPIAQTSAPPNATPPFVFCLWFLLVGSISCLCYLYYDA